MKVTRTEPSDCPRCGYKLDASTYPYNDEVTPKEGDVSICLKCAGVNVFGPELKPRLPTAEEAMSMLMHPEVIRVQSAIKHMWAKQN